jgi:phosphate transport system substrate-binding protein
VHRIFATTFVLTMLLSGCGQESPSQANNSAPEPTHNASEAAASNGVHSDMVQWLQPAIPDLLLRSEEEKKVGVEHGREPPPHELLQPTLDPDLPGFVPSLDPQISGTFIGGASDVLPGLIDLWLERFGTYYPNVNIEVGSPYAGSLGMLAVIEGTYDFVFVSRELKPTDISSFNEKYGYDPLTVPVAGGSYRHYGFLDAIGFFVNINNPLDKITYAQIDAIFSSTRHHGNAAISRWGELGLSGEMANQAIHAYGIEPWNGFEEFARQRILSVGTARGEWRDDVRFSHQSFPLSEQVANDPLAIGYTGLAYITRGVKMLPISVGEDSEYLSPSYENVASARYPLSRLIFFNTNPQPETGVDPVLNELLRFVLSAEGQQAVLDHAIFLPLRKFQYDQSMDLVN